MTTPKAPIKVPLKAPPKVTPNVLYHVTTQAKAKRYRDAGRINAPVRGFTTVEGAMFWAMKVGRKVIYEIQVDNPHKLPDHHNLFGEAWWNDGDVTEFQCCVSAT